MRQTLQQKFNFLAVVLVLFFLLMLPIFQQVKADTRDSMDDVKNTWLSKFANSARHSFKPRNVNEIDVENINPDDWSKQAKEADPQCGTRCDPAADYDGDGVSNGDELKQKRNPFCNETEKGEDFCKKQDRTKPPVDPIVNKTRHERIELYNVTLTLGTNCDPGPAVYNNGCSSSMAPFAKNFTRMEFFVNVSQVQAVQWSFTFQGSVSPIWQAGGNPQGGFGQTTASRSAHLENVTAGAQLTAVVGVSGGQGGIFEFRVYGINPIVT